jgi:molybdenum cofactor cytidylyltransferase
MRFGLQPLNKCTGAILAHGLSLPGTRLRKGHVLSADDVALCAAQGIEALTVAVLETGDVSEDIAAAKLAAALCGADMRIGNSSTGRANLYATADGVLAYDVAALQAFNRLDEGMTLALLQLSTVVRRGQMIGTVKIIPFALPTQLIAKGIEATKTINIFVHVIRAKTAVLLQTTLADTKTSVLAKSVDVTRARLEALGATFEDAGTVPHDTNLLADRLRALQADMILIVGASAIADRADIIPASIIAAGGSVSRFGMPVDPGNLLCLGQLGAAHVIGLPGCARSPKRNGFDMVLERLCAGLAVRSDDIAAMGQGGLLEDVAERALPRTRLDQHLPAPRIGAILLAAGRSSRMGEANKLLLPTSAGPLVARAAQAAKAAGITEIIAVLGHQAEAVGAALAGHVTQMIFNPDFASGMASSIRAGLAAAPADWDGVFILLGDMPLVQAASLRQLMAAFAPAQGRDIIVPMVAGQRANPILWARRYWPQLLNTKGDMGGRVHLLAAGDAVCEVMLEDCGLLSDVDDPTSWDDIKTKL